MAKAGIIDPTEGGASRAAGGGLRGSLLITTEAMVPEKPEKKAAPAMPGGGMDDMDY